MFIRNTRSLRGPNIWTSEPVLEARVELGDLAGASTRTIPGMADRLRSWLSLLDEFRCGPGGGEASSSRLQEGTDLVDVLMRVGSSPGAGRLALKSGWIRPTGSRGVRVAITFRAEELGLQCLETALSFCLAAVSGRPVDVLAEARRLREFADGLVTGVIVPAVLDEARRRGIPALRPYPALTNALASSGKGRGNGPSPPPRLIGPAPSPSRSPPTRS